MEYAKERNLDYGKLKRIIFKAMPPEYLTGTIVEEKHYQNPPSVYDLNFNPYRNGGMLLSSEFRFFDNVPEVLNTDGQSTDGLGYNTGKGMWWLPRYFWAMEKHGERHLLPCAFISLFLRHYKNLLSRRRKHGFSYNFNLDELQSQSDKELLDNDYDLPDHRCKDFLCTNTQGAFKAGIHADVLSLNDESEMTEEKLANIIVRSIKFMTDTYRMEYWTYSDEDIEKAKTMEKNITYGAQEELLRRARVK